MLNFIARSTAVQDIEDYASLIFWDTVYMVHCKNSFVWQQSSDDVIDKDNATHHVNIIIEFVVCFG